MRILKIWLFGQCAENHRLEPWIGRASSVGDSYRIEDKYGIIKLAEDSFYRAAYKIFML